MAPNPVQNYYPEDVCHCYGCFILDATLSAGGEVCARGEVVAVQIPDHLVADGAAG